MTDPALSPAKTSRSGAQAIEIAKQLRADIISGVFGPGETLRQEQLAKRFRSSRMPVRDALRILEQEGLVDMQPNRGAQVARLDADGFREIYEMRAVAEVLALKHAIPELTDSRIEQAAVVQDRAEQADIEQFGRLNKAFHETLYQPCGRPRLLAHIAGLNELADRYLRIAVIELDYVQRSNAEHHALLSACRARNIEKACSLLERHITEAGDQLFPRLQGMSSGPDL